ncbi:T9SS type A sorting domain-containing protein [Candidatus Neomarinimicrobiota bacterium]
MQYWSGEEWISVMNGVGGSWKERRSGVDVDAESVWLSDTPIETTKFRLAAWSDGVAPLWSFHIRGRGGTTWNWSEADTLLPDGTMSNHFKSILLQYVDSAEVEPWSYYVSPPFDLVGNSSSNKAHLSWSMYNSHYLDYYKIYRDLNSPATTLLDSVSQNALYYSYAYTDTGLTNGVAYYYRVTAVSIGGNETEFSNEVAVIPGGLDLNESNKIPKKFAIHPNYPNPFNPVTMLTYDLPEAANVSLIVYDMLGREVVKLIDNNVDAGSHQVQWNGHDLPSGIYIARLEIPEYTKSIKMLLLK